MMGGGSRNPTHPTFTPQRGHPNMPLDIRALEEKMICLAQREDVLDQKETVVTGIYANVERMKAELEAASAALEERETGLIQNDEMAGEIRRIHCELQDTRSESMKLNQELTSSLNMITALSNELKTSREQFSKSQDEISQKDQQILEIQTDKENLSNTITTLKDQNSDIQSKLSSETKRADDCFSQLIELGNHVNNFKDSAQVSAKEQANTIENLELAMQQQSFVDHHANKEITELTNMLTTSEASVKTHMKKVESLFTEKGQLVVCINTARDSFTDLFTEITSVKADVRVLVDAATRTLRNNIRTRDTMESAVTEVTALVDIIHTQQRELKSRASDIETLTSRRKKAEHKLSVILQLYPQLQGMRIPQNLGSESTAANSIQNTSSQSTTIGNSQLPVSQPLVHPTPQMLTSANIPRLQHYNTNNLPGR